MLFAGRAASRAAVMAAISSGLLAGSAQADDTTGPLTGQTPRGQADVTFTSNGAGGGTLITGGDGVRASAVGSIEDGSLNGTSDSFLSPGALGIEQTGGSATEVSGKTVAKVGVGAGAFSLLRWADNLMLLSGVFSGMNLGGTSGSSATSVNAGLSGGAYNGGLFRDEIRTRHPGDTVVGTSGFSLSASSPKAGSPASGGLGSFGAQALSGTLDTTTTTTAVPEPGEWMVIGMATVGLGGLMIRARRRRGAVAA